MHDWSEENFDWSGLNAAGASIGYWLRKWVRMDVRDVKEKFGTLRIYCSFGWSGVYSIWRPGYCWYPKWWPRQIDSWLSDTVMFNLLNKIVASVQRKAYVWRYKRAVQKWPHLYKEIVCCADYGELFDGKVPGYKHNDFWQEVK